MYIPFNYEQINLVEGHYSPSQVKIKNNEAFDYWCRSLFQRACSSIIFNLPDTWQGEVRDFFYYCLFRFGRVAIFNNDKVGLTFQPCQLSGQGWYYQPIKAIISNPEYSDTLTIHKDCEVIKMTPDYKGIWDIIEYYAYKLALLDTAIDMSLINNKFAFALGAKNKSAAGALKKLMDKINSGEPTVIYDSAITSNDREKNEPFHMLERHNLKESYLTTDQLRDFQTIINQFDCEIGIPTVPYEKKERLIESEAESKQLDATSRATVWLETLKSSLKLVNNTFNTSISVELRYEPSRGVGDTNE